MTNTLLKRFLKNIEARGLKIVPGDGETLHLTGPAAEKTPEIISACKLFKPDLLKMFRPELANDPANTTDTVAPTSYAASFTKPTTPAVSDWEQCRTCQQHVQPQAMQQAPIALCPLEVPKKQPASATLGKDARPCPYRR